LKKSEEMKNYLTLAGLCLVMLFLYSDLNAQQRLSMDLGYSINRPSGQFDQVISKPSYRGFKGGISYAINEQFDVGLGVLYSDFYEKTPRQVYQTAEGAISAVISNSIQVMPLVVKAKYNFIKEGPVKPYLGAGAGVNLVNYDQYFGEFPASKVAVKPAVTGEAGVRFPLGLSKRSGLDIGAHYMYLPFKYNGIENLNAYGAHIGLYFPLR
jgi:opacity protein-like surface antigen